ncbi:fibronectin type III domain-containing protein [Flavivirga eckloniae]|uniref:Fibronectin type-III domain-containing protein n=1 Tax=Flavivirga eckloniae TaxID=1803846 RepID=A0A2K9PU36_9FLAO|nr:fibronectin type III domain-containing protein [Flavivirga eckloniae]AUP80576.1 hypothetical protein C1H87_18400 [Flavivirga eckloniae]
MINYNKHIKPLAYLFVLLIIAGCGGSDDGGDGGGNTTPKAAALLFPLENSECNEGTIVSDEMSTVPFEWEASENTDSYTLVIENLLDNTVKNVNTQSTTVQETILRGVPYAWLVVSKVNGSTQTAISPKWRFYNAGAPVENHAPFPAELVSPVMGGLAVTSPDLKWTGSDIDNDIESYDVYLDTANPPTTLLTNTSSSNASGTNLNPDTVYYWKVVTKDGHGNTSQSPVFEFRTQ